ncbi:MAG: T9SS type A sorting domain-containing protein [Bacteroidota bacterium]
MKNIMRCLVTMLFVGTISTQLMAQWVQTDGPYAGKDVLVFASSPSGTSGTNLFVGTREDGIFLSTNNGANWTAVNSGLKKAEWDTTKYGIVNALAINGTNLIAYLNGDIYRSTNNGKNWINAGLQSIVGHVLAYAGTNLFACQGGRIFRSTNNGLNWSFLSSTIKCNIWSFASIPDGIGGTKLFVGTEYEGIFMSTNNGESWTAVNSGLRKASYDTTRYAGIHALAVNGTNIFAGAVNGGVFLSTSNGTTWTDVSTGLTNSVYALAVSGSNLFAGMSGGDVFLSTNNGTSWQKVSNGLRSEAVFDFAICDTNLFAGTEGGGVYLSTNNGSSWTDVNYGMGSSGVSSMIDNPFGPGGTNLFAGTSNGVFFSSNNGTSWKGVNDGLSPGGVSSLAVSSNAAGSNNLFVGTGYDGIYLSTNNGTSWSAVNTGLTNKRVTSLVVDESYIYAGVSFEPNINKSTRTSEHSSFIDISSIYLSTNDGASWIVINTPFIGATITALMANNHNIFVGAPGYGIFRSTDNGTSWIHTDSSLSNIGSFAVIGTAIFAAAVKDNIPGVYLSTNNGANWTVKNTGLQNSSVNALVVSGNNLFAGTYDGGIYLSTNNGTSWTGVSTGLNKSMVFSLAISGSNLFAGTNSGVWRRPLSEMITDVKQSTTQLPEKYSLSQNFPNPFNPSTIIRYSLPSSANVKLTVYDLLGREIATLVNEEQSAGLKEVEWNASAFSSGIYFYKITAGSFVDVKKMLIVK